MSKSKPIRPPRYDYANKIRNSGEGGCFASLLFLLFLALKLTGYITWSWWWVTSPLWIPPAIVISLVVIVGIIVGSFYFGRRVLR